ncbi:hypothetical protein C8Q75DRAFT_206669 [Abortiporus biennis]|nr:hypothetical protein C8Q75DRAFT_206669 [Abortiporus biennis]
MPVPTITGYYRFTDIYFEWHQALPNIEDIGPLKATISYNALVDPGHPLRKEGVDGIELFIGTFENGEARLLFSSAQVEYIRYWLHAMGMTKEILPLPSSDYLITQSSLMSCSPAIYKDAAVLKKAIRTIDKNNKRLKGTQPLLTSRRLSFERIRTYWASKKGTWLAIDIESWDRDHTMITEFGWSLVRWEDGQQIEEMDHLIVAPYKYHRNTYVEDNKENYLFGVSEEVSKAEFKRKICELIGKYQQGGPLFLIFHDPSQDIKDLRSPAIDAPLPNLNPILPDTTPSEGLYVIDTADMFAALEGESGVQKRSLERICRLLKLGDEFGVQVDFFHNAGNDAHFTLLALKSMASGDPVDVQREKRWPNSAISNEPKAIFTPEQEGYESSDDDIIHVGEDAVMQIRAQASSGEITDPNAIEDNLWA